MTSLRGSVIPEAKAAIVGLLQAATWPAQASPYAGGGPSPQIVYGPSGAAEQDRISVSDTAVGSAEQRWMTFRPSRLEVFELAVDIVCATPGLSCQQAVERAFGLFDVFAAVMLAAAQTDPKLGVGGVTAVQVAQPSHRELGTDEGFIVTVETAVLVEAQVAPVVA